MLLTSFKTDLPGQMFRKLLLAITLSLGNYLLPNFVGEMK